MRTRIRAAPAALWAFIRRFWGWFIAVPLTLYGVFALIRDEFLSEALREQLRIGGLLGKLRWEHWVISGLLFLVLVTYAPKLRDAVRNTRESRLPSAPPPAFNPDGLRIAPGYSVSFPSDRTQGFSFTVVNDSGVDITECSVTLDRSEFRVTKDDEWQLEQVELLDAPFRWNRSTAGPSGRLTIEAGDRVSFTLGQSSWFPAMDAKTKQTTGIYQFTLALLDLGQHSGQFELMINYFYRLLISIRAKDRNSSRLPIISYQMQLKPTASSGPAGGLEVHEVRRLQ
jgi:hypothetical protein